MRGPSVAAVERRMTDTVTILNDPQGTADDVFDPDTGTYTPPPNDELTVYTGKALISAAGGGRGLTVEEGGGQAVRRRYSVSIPLSDIAITKGQTVVVTDSRDPELVGVTFRVAEVDLGTLVSRRRVLCDLVRGGPAT